MYVDINWKYLKSILSAGMSSVIVLKEIRCFPQAVLPVKSQELRNKTDCSCNVGTSGEKDWGGEKNMGPL
jgi:hypothetical protein